MLNDRARGFVRLGVFAVGSMVALSACDEGAGAPAAAGSAASSAGAAPSGVVAAIPQPAASVAKVVDPAAEPPYNGPVGKVKGTIRIKGDPAPDAGLSFPSGKCGEAAATYGKVFRTGQDGAVADVLVGVIGYKGYVPPREEAAKMTIHGCAFAKRTMAMTFGQRLEVYNLDAVESYMPYLDGSISKAAMVAIPGGDAVKMYPHQPGHYMLRDNLAKPFLTSDVYVLKYATHDVTGLDGQYEIAGVPVGKARVNAFLPSIDRTVFEEIDVAEGDNTVDLVIEYANSPAPAGSAAPAAGSAAPAAGSAAPAAGAAGVK